MSAQRIQGDSRHDTSTGALPAWPTARICRKHPLGSPVGIIPAEKGRACRQRQRTEAQSGLGLASGQERPGGGAESQQPRCRVLIGLEEGGLLQAPGVRAALATALFRAAELSLMCAAHVAEVGWLEALFV